MTEVRKMLTVEDVVRLLRVSRTTLFRMERERKFPKGRALRGRKVWFENEIAAWQDELPDIPQRAKR